MLKLVTKGKKSFSVHDIFILEVKGLIDTAEKTTQSVCVADCYFIVNVLDLPFASPIAIYR